MIRPLITYTVFPNIVSAETIPFFNLEIVENSNICANFNFLPNKLCGNYCSLFLSIFDESKNIFVFFQK